MYVILVSGRCYGLYAGPRHEYYTSANDGDTKLNWADPSKTSLFFFQDFSAEGKPETCKHMRVVGGQVPSICPSVTMNDADHIDRYEITGTTSNEGAKSLS